MKFNVHWISISFTHSLATNWQILENVIFTESIRKLVAMHCYINDIIICSAFVGLQYTWVTVMNGHCPLFFKSCVFSWRSLRIHRNPGICRNLQWQKAFSTNSFLLYHKRTDYYPTDQIKNLEDFEKYASPEEKDRLEFIRSEFIDYCRAGKFEVSGALILINVFYTIHLRPDQQFRLLVLTKVWIL